MKRFLAIFVAIITLFGLASCKKSESNELDWNKTALADSYTVGAVEGAPTLSLVNVVDGGFTYAAEGKSVTTEVTVAADAKDVVSKLKNGEYDMAILPLNNAVTLYEDSGKREFRLASVNVFGVLYMIGKTDVTSFSDLKGKVINCVGYGGTPGLILKHLLKNNNVEYAEGANAADNDRVYINAISAPAEAKGEYVVLGEPAVTAVCKQSGRKVVMDFKAEWQKIHGENAEFTQAGLVVNVSKVNKKYVESFVNHLKNNREFLYANESAINDKLRAMGSNGPISKLTYNKEILDRCSIDCKTAISQKKNVEEFLRANGVATPDASFYGV